MENNVSKPKLLYFSPSYEGTIVVNNLEVIVYRVDEWLREFFDVVQISSACDFSEVVDKHKPDLVLFDGFVEGTHHKLKYRIDNLSAHRTIPRAGFCRVDSLSPGRGPLLAYLDRCGVEAVFVLGDTSMGEAFREIADRIIYIPQFVNAAIFKDYGQIKTIPMLLVGNFDSYQYPWRCAVKEPLMRRFPYLLLRHPGYNIEHNKDSAIIVWGEQFARTVNTSMVVPTSGGFKNIAISKHIEIPAAKSCLVTDYSPTLAAYGFRDMENCVFAEAHEAPDKIEHLFRNRTILERVTDQGFRFVHERHTSRHRPQLYQWLKLKKIQGPAQKIVQPDLFGDLQLVDKSSDVCTLHLETAADLALIREGDKLLWQGKFVEAESCYLRVFKFCHYVCEPGLRIAIIRLLQGRGRKSLWELDRLLQYFVSNHHHYTDPVEWAYFLFAILCSGDVAHLESALQMIPDVRRMELDSARWIIYTALEDKDKAQDILVKIRNPGKQHHSVHDLPHRTFEEHVAIFCTMLEACKLTVFLERVKRALDSVHNRIDKPTDSPSGVFSAGLNELLAGKASWGA